ncbi:MAG: GEVED domain-containing protein [Bacteroidota bacterium]
MKQNLLFLFCLLGIINLNSQTVVTIGAASTLNGPDDSSPINVYYRSHHCQVLYTPADINGGGWLTAGTISKLGFNIYGTTSEALPNFSIKLKNTSAPNVNTYDGAGLSTVYTSPSYFPTAGGFELLTLDNSFIWDGTSNLLIDICFDQVSAYTSTGRVYLSPYSNSGAEYAYTRDDGSPVCGVPTNTGASYGYNTTFKPQLQLELTALPLCSGTPVSGDAVSTSNNACFGTSFDLNLINNSINSGLQYQWQSSPNGSSWTNLGSVQPTPLMHINSFSVTTYYQCVTTCTASSSSATSTPVTVNLNPLMNCYCTPAYFVDCSSDRFQDFSVANVTLQGTNCDANGYSDSTMSNYTTVNLTAGNTYTLSTNAIINASYGNAVMGAWIDYNQNATFEANEFIYLGYGGTSGTYSTSFNVPVTATGGSIRMRLKFDEYYADPTTTIDPCLNNNNAYVGQILDYKVNMTAAPACSGAPNAGNATSTQTAVCQNVNYTLDLINNEQASGISYQWQSSPNASTWTNLGAPQNTIPYFVTTQSVTTHYRCVITCTSAALSGTSTAVTVNQNLPTTCYCTPENTSCTGSNITNVTFETISDVPVCAGYGYSDNTVIASTASLTANQTYSISIDLFSQGSPGQLALWIDYDQNGFFEFNEYTYVGIMANGTLTTNITVPYTAVGGATRMRIKLETMYVGPYDLDPCLANASGGQTIDYSINIAPAAPCSGIINPGNTVAPTGVCPGEPFTLNLTGNDMVSGATYQWFSSPNGSTYTALGGLQTSVPYYVSGQSATTYYMCTVTCPASGSSNSSINAMVSMNSFLACYCVPDPMNCSGTDLINYVSLATMTNTSTCGTDGYTDFMGSVPSATLNAGQTYTLTTVLGYDYGEKVSVWIDYNQNGIFDASEYTYMGSNSGNDTIINSISIPMTALLGNTKMRVRNIGSGYPLGQDDACYTPAGGGAKTSGQMGTLGTGFEPPGETEDYLITLLPPDCSTLNYPPSYNVTGLLDICQTQSSLLDISPAVQTATGITYEWFYFNGSSYVSTGAPSVSSQYMASPTTNTLYYCEVQCNTSPVRNSDTVNVKVHTITTAPVSTSITCNGNCNGSITLNASSTGSLTYVWSSGSTSDMVTGLCSGNYNVSITSIVGCVLSQSFAVTEPAALMISSTQTNVTCFGGSDGAAMVNVSGGTGPYSYFWSGGFGSLPGNTINSSVFAQTYTCTITDANNCTKDEIIVVSQPAQILVNITGNSNVCQETSATYTANVSNGVGSMTYTWTTSNTSQTSNNAIFDYTAETAGSDILSVSVTDVNGCTQTSANYNVTSPASTGISGMVTTNPSVPVAGIVVLYKYLPFYTKFDSVGAQTINASGAYNFASFTSGIYIVEAIPTNTTTLQNAYGDAAVNWKTATQIIHGCATNDVQNIDVKALAVLTGTGTGSLSGKITQGLGFDSTHRVAAGGFKPLVPGTPIGGIIVKGGKNPGGQMFVQTTTDSNGDYSLNGLPPNDTTLGESYFILVDIPGLDTNNTYHKIITLANDQFTGLDFVVDSAKINPIPTSAVGINDITAIENQIKVYPNPASSYVTIQYNLKNSSLVKIELFDMLGRSVKLMMPETQQGIDLHKQSWHTDDLRSGLYFIKMSINGSESIIKLSVTN